MKKLVLSSVAQVVNLINNNPDLLAVHGLAALKSLIDSAKLQEKPGTCNRCQKKNQSLAHHKPQVEAALSNLSEADYLSIKNLLKLDKLCYYHKINGTLTQTCV